MLLSMTGYGREETSHGDKTIIVEVRSLNGKQADVRVKTSIPLGQKEIELRKFVQESAVRGKVDVTLEIKGDESMSMGVPNEQAIRKYFHALRDIANDLVVSDEALFSSVLKLPNVMQAENGELSEELWQAVLATADSALRKLHDFRSQEGTSLLSDMKLQIETILTLLGDVEANEGERTAALRERLEQRIREMDNEHLDKNRFEQEVLHYLDKMDINEEKVRLEQHCHYFIEVLQADREGKGRELNFISQEIGREINTLGAKAQWSPIQHTVVQMKKALEQIKEQLANTL